MEHIFKSNKNDIRIDTFLSGKIDNVSRAYISKLINENKIKCNGKICKPSLKLKEGDIVEAFIPEPEAMSAKPQEIELDVVYDDEYIAVINKPQGMVVHPAPGHKDNTLVNALMYKYRGELSDINGVIRPGIVHRIDKDTSGLILIVKKNSAHTRIAKSIQNHDVKRTYRTLVHGIISEEKGTINLPIGRNPNNRLKNAVIKDGKHAISHFKVLKRFLSSNITYVEVELETGRTHQIRVHFSHIKHPILGDPMYGGIRKDIKTNGQILHAYKLEFLHPITNDGIIVKSKIPDYFQQVLDLLISTEK